MRESLLAWYDEHQRKLPWRAAPSLYRTVISEFMLQQTQVATVLPYFDRWMQKFPDFEALAAAQETEVLKAWEGLGYYSRARNLHKLAKELGSMNAPPTTYAGWLTLPGIGPYTAAAVTSIAFEQPEAVVDGNVIRVLARVTADDTVHKDAASATKAYRPLAQKLLHPERPGDFNQAVMELGATVCRPKKPTCLLCPWLQSCQGQQSGDPERFPRKKQRKIIERRVNRLFQTRQHRGDTQILLEKIPDDAARLAGQFQLPEVPPNISLRGKKPLLTKTRGIGNERIAEPIFSLKKSIPLADKHHWIALKNLPDLTIPGPHRRWIEELLNR